MTCPNDCGQPYDAALGHLGPGMDPGTAEARCLAFVRGVDPGGLDLEAALGTPLLPTAAVHEAPARGDRPAASAVAAGHFRPPAWVNHAVQVPPHPGLRGVVALTERAARAVIAGITR